MEILQSSFRDPAGYLFRLNGKLYRAITAGYLDTYNAIKESGLFKQLITDGRIIGFTEQPGADFPPLENAVPLVLEPEIVPFVSYPYEWSFSQLKDAALLTLDLHLAGLERNFLLKDASAYNVQFVHGRPVFIDHLSFDACDRYPTWPAYGQFCRHFLAPLLLMAKVDPGLQALFRTCLDGIPLPLARKLIPVRKLLSFGLLIHFAFHASAQKKYADRGEMLKKMKKLSPRQMLNIAISLRETVGRLSWEPEGTEWGEYYRDTNYSDCAMHNKVEILVDFVQRIPRPAMIWDFGGNTGRMSRAVQEYADTVVCFDLDAAAVEKNYLQGKKNNERKMLPLVMDFTNPSPDLGFACRERDSLHSRGRADLGLALGLVHHLAVSNNIPLGRLARYLASLCRHLVIEFIPKNDSQVQRLLLSRHDIFEKYSLEDFIHEFSSCFEIVRRERVADSERTLFLMKSRNHSPALCTQAGPTCLRATHRQMVRGCDSARCY